MSVEADYFREIAWQEVFFEHYAELPWPLLLAAVKRMHHADLATVTTVAFGRVPILTIRAWHGLLVDHLASQPDGHGPPDPYEQTRRIALAVLLAAKAPPASTR